MRICKNEITDHIRDHFGANPLKVPEARIRPLSILEIRKNRQQYLGEFKYLLRDEFDFDIPIQMADVSEVSHKRSKSIDFSTGFDILSGFLKALKVDPASISAAMTKSKRMAFSFSNVRRKYLDPLLLGHVLSKNDIYGDTDNFVLQPAITNSKIKLGLITDVMVSNNFSLTALSESDTELKIDVPLIKNAIADLEGQLKVEKMSESEVQFQGSEDLTFAFSCLELKIDPETGKFSRGDWLKNIRDIKGEARSFDSLKPEENILIDRIILDDNDEYPLLIDF